VSNKLHKEGYWRYLFITTSRNSPTKNILYLVHHVKIINIRKYRKALMKLDDKVKVINLCDRWWEKLLDCGSVSEEKGVGRTQIMNIL
jgi:hypothetical protein